MISVQLFVVFSNNDSCTAVLCPWKSRYNLPEASSGGCDCIEDDIVTYKGYRFLVWERMKYSMRQHHIATGRWKSVSELNRKIRKNKVLMYWYPMYPIWCWRRGLCHQGFKSFLTLLGMNQVYVSWPYKNYGKQERIRTYHKTTIKRIRLYTGHIINLHSGHMRTLRFLQAAKLRRILPFVEISRAAR